MKKVLFLTMALTMLIGLMLKGTFGYFGDEEPSASNTFTGWNPIDWVQTSRDDFESGVLNNVDTVTSPGDVILNLNTEIILASDGFESNDWSGGTGWVADWWHEGNAEITSKGKPYNGDYHLLLTNIDGYLERMVNLTGNSNVHLKFRAKADSFEGGEFARCLVSPDYSNWTAVQTWVDGNDDKAYHFYDIDLSCFSMTSEFWIAFDAEMADNKDYLYIDDISLVYSTFQGSITGTAASQVLDTGFPGARLSALSWGENLNPGTDITLEVRASDTQFTKSDVTPSWTAMGGTSPVESGLPTGRYMQWRATLTTTELVNSPVLEEVTINYY